MADVTGPISTLSGTAHAVPDGQTCDEHPDRLAVVRVQGETDSFGCEMIDMCQECVDAERAYRQSDEGKAEAIEAATGTCEWCSGHATDLRDKRDYEEGMSGRVYRVCGACRSRRDAEDAAYLDSYGDWD